MAAAGNLEDAMTDDLDDLEDRAAELFEAWAEGERLPPISWTMVRRYWLAGFQCALDELRDGD